MSGRVNVVEWREIAGSESNLSPDQPLPTRNPPVGMVRQDLYYITTSACR
jgi:hypothetical protein